MIGNFYDRMGWWHGEEIHPDYAYGVRDFILFTYQDYVWPNFNLADCLLVCGAFLLLIYSFKYEEPDSAGKEKEIPSVNSAAVVENQNSQTT